MTESWAAVVVDGAEVIGSAIMLGLAELGESVSTGGALLSVLYTKNFGDSAAKMQAILDYCKVYSITGSDYLSALVEGRQIKTAILQSRSINGITKEQVVSVVKGHFSPSWEPNDREDYVVLNYLTARLPADIGFKPEWLRAGMPMLEWTAKEDIKVLSILIC
jgi:hypothetical protein